MADGEIIEAIGVRQGLARAPLFRAGEGEDPEAHAVWLDGRDGSFALSVVPRREARDAVSWAWSSGNPHHVTVDKDDVEVVRWDAPSSPITFARKTVLQDPEGFYAHLHQDRVTSQRSIVKHCLDTFRAIRNLAYHRDLDDKLALDLYLAFLADLSRGGDSIDPSASALRTGFDLAPGAVDLLRSMPARELGDIASRFRREGARGNDPRPFPRLALRHASGEIFQEAHFALVSRPGPNLFANVDPAASRKPDRGAVHFTPPYLARSLAEEAIRRVAGFKSRKSITLMDIACGSAAFLVEGLRALERLGYQGRVRVVGRDTSEVAIHMARFAVGIAAREWPGDRRVEVDIKTGDALRDPLPEADVILMNPPFARGQSIPPGTRDLLRKILSLKGGHLDLSMGFVMVAARAMRPGGALATLVPARLLEAAGTAPWRLSLAEGRGVSLRATFGELRLFTHAMVDVGAVVLTVGDPDTAQVDVRADNQGGSAGDALRALRRGPDEPGLQSGIDGRWQIQRGPRAIDWLGQSAEDEEAPSARLGATSVTDLFDVLQGVRSGYDRAFVRTRSEVARLPAAERAFYQRAVASSGIADGRIVDHIYVFYPYGEGGRTFSDEAALRRAVPETYTRYLEPSRARLSARSGKAIFWWELTHRARRIFDRSPLVVSKWFASPGGIALDLEGGNLVQQGHGWDPKGPIEKALARRTDGGASEMALAYLAVLNSNAFFAMVAQYTDGPVLQGGQFDMSGRHLARVPLVDLTTRPRDVAPLARFARSRYLRVDTGEGVCPSANEIEDWTAEALARARPEAPFHRGKREGALPEWATCLMTAGSGEPSEATYVDVIAHLREASRSNLVGEVDDVLRHIPTGELPELALITLVRTTFGFRERLANWIAFRDRVETELARRGRPARKILFGLYQ